MMVSNKKNINFQMLFCAEKHQETRKFIIAEMGKLAWLVFLVLYQIVHSLPVDSEDDILPYLRGMGWRNVEKELM